MCGTGPKRGAANPTSHQTSMSKLSVPNLVQQGKLAAHLYDECDVALSQLNESFGVPYDAARSNLTNDLVKADLSGVDLSLFQGKESLFRFPEHNANIVVRITKSPTAHSKIDKLDDKIAQLEQKLKVAKLERKQLIDQLKLTFKVDFITDKINLAFSRIK
jgi:hypothetical protein